MGKKREQPSFSLSINRPDVKLRFKGKVSTAALREIRRIVDNGRQNYRDDDESGILDNGYINEIDNVDVGVGALSSALRNKEEFLKLVNRLLEEEDEYTIRRCRIRNIIDLEVNNGSVSRRSRLDYDEWKSSLREMMEGINKSGASFVIIHLLSGLPAEEKERIIDSLSLEFFNVPKKIFKSSCKGAKTLVEMVIFGSNIENKSGYF